MSHYRQWDGTRYNQGRNTISTTETFILLRRSTILMESKILPNNKEKRCRQKHSPKVVHVSARKLECDIKRVCWRRVVGHLAKRHVIFLQHLRATKDSRRCIKKKAVFSHVADLQCMIIGYLPQFTFCFDIIPEHFLFLQFYHKDQCNIVIIPFMSLLPPKGY